MTRRIRTTCAPTKKIQTAAYIGAKSSPKGDLADLQAVTYFISRNTKIPAGASHILVFTKNEWGEMATGVSTKVVDNTKPCIEPTNKTCAGGIWVAEDTDMEKGEAAVSVRVDRAEDETAVTKYSLYWGRSGCEDGQGQSGAKNGFLVDVSVPQEAGESLVHEVLENTLVPDHTTHVLVFPRNQVGESSHCKAAAFVDVYTGMEAPPLPQVEL